MKKIFLSFFIIIIVLFGGNAFADDFTDGIIDSMSEEYYGEIDNAVEQSGGDGFIDFDAEKIIKKAAKGEELFSLKNLFSAIFQKLVHEINLIAKSMVCLFAVSILGSFLFAASEKEDGNSAAAAKLCIYMVSAGIMASVFANASETAVDAVGRLSVFLKAVFPVIIASLYSVGCVSSVAVLQPVIAAAIQLSVHLTEKLFIPVITVSFAVCCVNTLSKEINADKLIQFLQKSVKTCLAAMLIIFIGLVGIESIATSSADGLAIKLTKFAASNLVPVVGGILSESVETVMGCSQVIKNSVGICGIIATLYLCLAPMLKLGASIIVLRISAAVMEPVCDKRIIKCISDAAGAVSMLFAMVASVAVMFILITAIIINTGNSAIITGR